MARTIPVVLAHWSTFDQTAIVFLEKLFYFGRVIQISSKIFLIIEDCYYGRTRGTREKARAGKG